MTEVESEADSEADEAAESDEGVAPDDEAAPETTADSSEAARGEIWIEKYRPQRLDEVAGHEDITERLSRYVERDDLPNLLFSGPAGVGKTTSAVAIAKELYGDDWESNFLELNASDQRGIDVVRDRIKNFARSSFGGANYRIIFLDEADSLTSDAQSALRRTMEQFSNNTRFILSCNYSSKIIDPIQSRCATFRFGPISEEGVTEQILKVAEQEGIETTEDGIEALVYAADGDMRKAINALQAAAVMGEVVDEEAVFTITSTARPEEIEEMVTYAIEGDFSKARSILDDLLTNKGMAGGDIIDQLHRSVWEFELSDEATVRLMDRVGEVDYRITEGANERVQLEALLASLSLEDQ
ncbi:replication factor C small subunit [Halorussus salinus]|uniref:replication factor C small subunit n=1 Tax=Halorussus salinus TaxID=1364935 RepID=UPI0010918B05|nr:replication factor C small subunit [Halorussus salinus]